MHPVVAIVPAERHVHHQIEHPEALATFRRPPSERQAHSRNEALHEVELFRTGSECIEGYEREAERRRSAVPLRLGSARSTLPFALYGVHILQRFAHAASLRRAADMMAKG